MHDRDQTISLTHSDPNPPRLDTSRWNLARPGRAVLAAMLPLCASACAGGEDPVEAGAEESAGEASAPTDADRSGGNSVAQIEQAFDVTIVETGYDGLYDLAIGECDELFGLTFHYAEGASWFDFKLRSFADDGSDEWVLDLPTATNFHGISVDGDRVVAFGSLYDGDDRSGMLYTVDARTQIPLGEPVVLNALAAGSDWIDDVTRAGGGKVYVTGGKGDYQPWAAKVDPVSGSVAWMVTPNFDGGLVGVDTQADGDVWFLGSRPGSDQFLLRYNAAGTLEKSFSGATQPPGSSFTALRKSSLLFSNADGYGAYNESLAPSWTDGSVFTTAAGVTRHGRHRFAAMGFTDGALRLAVFDDAGKLKAQGDFPDFVNVNQFVIPFGFAVGEHTLAVGMLNLDESNGRVVKFTF